MDENEIKLLQQELEEFKKEKERVRKFVGQIGGTDTNRKDKILNIGFIAILVSLFATDIMRHIFEIKISVLPALLSLELGVLLISIKIIWMIYKQTKVEHFQFWILNSIEFRLNEVSKRTARIEKVLKERKGK